MDERTAERLLYLEATCAEIAVLAARGRPAYDEDIAVVRACQYNLVRLAADLERLGVDWLTAHPEVPWALVRGMRNRIAHDYRTLADNVVWDAVTRDVPALREGLQDEIVEAATLLDAPIEE